MRLLRAISIGILTLIIIFSTNQVCLSQIEYKKLCNTIECTAFGDLDRDGIPELIVVMNTDQYHKIEGENVGGLIREIQILKQVNGAYTLWQKSRNALQSSHGGGMGSNGLSTVKVEQGVLIIEYLGGSSWKYITKEKYRFQNDHFEMIGYTGSYGNPGYYWDMFDFNLSTGKLVFKREVSDYNSLEDYANVDITFYKKGVKINLQNRRSFEESINVPGKAGCSVSFW